MDEGETVIGFDNLNNYYDVRLKTDRIKLLSERASFLFIKGSIENKDEVFELSKNMMVKREDIPYQLGIWNFNDVAKKIMKKYQIYFAKRAVKTDVSNSNDNLDDRVCVKENSLA